MKSEKVKEEIEKAIAKTRDNRISITWVGLVGKETFVYCYKEQPEKVIATLKYNNGVITIIDERGNEETRTFTISQELQPVAAEETGRPVEQSDKKQRTRRQ